MAKKIIKKGTWGGARENSGGKRTGAGRKRKDRTNRSIQSFYIGDHLTKTLDQYSEYLGYNRSELVEEALSRFLKYLDAFVLPKEGEEENGDQQGPNEYEIDV